MPRPTMPMVMISRNSVSGLTPMQDEAIRERSRKAQALPLRNMLQRVRAHMGQVGGCRACGK